jgi:hypothetical protein
MASYRNSVFTFITQTSEIEFCYHYLVVISIRQINSLILSYVTM